MSARRVAGCLALLLAATLVAAPAYAEPSARDKETARALFNQGKDARAAGDPKTALERFAAAHALAATPITTVELARQHAQLGHLVQARELALSVARMPSASPESERAKQAREEAIELAESLRPRIATLTVTLEVSPTGSAPTMEVDGAAVAAGAVSAPQRLDPGTHRITAHVGAGPVASADVVLAEGESRGLTLEVAAPVAAPAPSSAAPASPAARARAPSSRATSRLVSIGFGTAGVGAIAGTLTGLGALAKASTSSCRDTRCSADGLSDIESGRTLATVSTIAFAVAVAGAGVGIYGLVAGGREATGFTALPRFTPFVGLANAGVTGSF